MKSTLAVATLTCVVAAAPLCGSQEGDLVALLTWEADREGAAPLTVTVRKGELAGDSLCVQRTRVGNCLFRVDDGQHFLGAFPTRDAGGVLMILWVTGSAYRLLGLGFDNGLVSTTLDVGSKQVPEFVWLEDDSQPAVIVARPRGALSSAAKGGEAEVYLWKDGRYHMQQSVPWDRRLERGTVRP